MYTGRAVATSLQPFLYYFTVANDKRFTRCRFGRVCEQLCGVNFAVGHEYEKYETHKNMVRIK